MNFSVSPITKPQTWKYMPLYEKIAYYKTQLGEEYATLVDKIEVKKIIPTLTKRVQCAPIIRILKSPDDLQEDDLQKPYLLKASHGSGWNIPLHTKTKEDLPALRKIIQTWNTSYIGNNEPHYAFLKPRFFLEEYVEDAEQGVTASATVFLIRCIRGKPVTISVKKGMAQNSYDTVWNPIRKYELTAISKPDYLEEMLEIASELAKPFEFVRVDLYRSTTGYIFSEYTFTPAGGNPYFSLTKERELGKLWLP